MTESIEGITLVSSKAEEHLNPRQYESYRSHRKRLIEWMLNLGKDPSKADGYAETTANTRARRLDKFYRWTWEQEGRDTENIITNHADRWMEHLAHQEVGGSAHQL